MDSIFQTVLEILAKLPVSRLFNQQLSDFFTLKGNIVVHGG